MSEEELKLPNWPFNMTHGVVLDPFSILVSGILRKNGQIRKGDIEDDMGWLHGEAKFKQAFVNACHFAESLTIIGPVAQLKFEDMSGNYATDFDEDVVTHPDIQWPMQPCSPGNDAFMRNLRNLLAKHKAQDLAEAAWMADGDEDVPFLPLHPDLLFGYKDEREGDDFMSALYRHNFGVPMKYFRDNIWTLKGDRGANVNGTFYRGAPAAALMAVVFTFKKPTGRLKTKELTNMGSWPPLVFLLPVLTPAGPEMDGYFSNKNLNRVLAKQPSLYSCKILNVKTKSIFPFGQPYTLTTVSAKGKTPDILRSLSDVFKALWSQKAQYSALSLSMENLDESGRAWGSLEVDPIGMGRRIRGHNRYSGRFRFQDLSFVSEDHSMHSVETEVVRPGRCYNGEHIFTRQLRNVGDEKAFRTMYMLPSFCKRMLEDNKYILPLILTMHRHLLGEQDITDFFDSRTGVDASVLNLFQQHYDVPDNDPGQSGKLPVSRVTCPVEFDPEGDPAVVGLSWSNEVMLEAAQAPSISEEVDIITSKTKKLTEFAHLDALTSSSTSDITSTFTKVKKVEEDELVTGDEEDEGFIDLFDGEEML